MKKFTFLFLVLVAFYSCDNEDTAVTINSQPMTIGSTWEYDRTIVFNNYSSEESNEIIKADTIQETYTVKVEKDTVLNDTMNVTVYKVEGRDGDYNYSEYRYLDKEGLKTYAYTLGGGVQVISKKNVMFPKPILLNVHASIYSDANPRESRIVEDGIRFNIPIPLNEQSTWIYYKDDRSDISKKVNGNESVDAANGSFSCLKVEWEYNNKDYTQKSMDWIAAEGLIKRTAEIGRVHFTDNEGNDLGLGDVVETIILKSINLK